MIGNIYKITDIINNKVYIGQTIIEASRSTGCDRRAIQRQLKGEYGKLTPRSFSNLKYIWKYKEQLTEQSN